MLNVLSHFRKAFLTRCFQIHYSQFGEDVILRRWLSRQNKGFYVDVGCYHPKKFSNTYYLYKKGWRGINIDMEQHKMDLFTLARKKDINITCAVSDKAEIFYIQQNKAFDLFATLTTKKTMSGIIPTQTLTEIIDKTSYKNQPIDLLTIDVEGHDFKVLKSLDFAIYQPKIVIVESHATDIQDILRSDIHIFMVEKGYSLRCWNLFSLIYRK